MSAEDAARLGVFVHGLAGDMASKERGEAGIIAGDLADHLPTILREIPYTDEEPAIRIR
jgi:NAD(P)H-hydrate repair Nnr-like enzyme with NAD(P)H-hydrate dehydratase domain